MICCCLLPMKEVNHVNYCQCTIFLETKQWLLCKGIYNRYINLTKKNENNIILYDFILMETLLRSHCIEYVRMQVFFDPYILAFMGIYRGEKTHILTYFIQCSKYEEKMHNNWWISLFFSYHNLPSYFYQKEQLCPMIL